MSAVGGSVWRVAGVCALLAVAAPLAAQQPQAPPDEHAAGRAVYTRWCAPCHAAGITHPGTNALTVKYAGVKSGVLLEWKDLPPETVAGLVRSGIAVMPPFRKVEISDAELAALARYLARNTPAQ
jgi:mono/diheme cytochrome c family protein